MIKFFSVLIVMAAAFAYAGGPVCRDINHGKNIVITNGDGQEICQNELGTDLPCVGYCIDCYGLCRGKGDVGNFLTDADGNPLCLCSEKSGASVSAPPSTTIAITTLTFIAMTIAAATQK